MSSGTLSLLHALQAAGKGLPDTHWATCYLGGHTFRVRPHGTQDGAAFLLTDDAMAVKLNPAPLAGMPTVQVELRSVWLWQLGAEAAVADAQRVVEDLVPDHVVLHPAAMQPHVTRLDVCADFQGWDPEADQLWPASVLEKRTGKRPDAGGLRCEARKVTPHFDASKELGHTGCDYGLHSSEISAGIYDKTSEIEESSKKDWFQEVWAKSADYHPEERVWRLEYRLRREAITGFLLPVETPEGSAALEHHVEKTTGELVAAPAGKVPKRVETWSDVKTCIGSIWRYLTGKWLCRRAPRKKKTRQVIDPTWLPFHSLDEKLLHDGAHTVLRKRLSKIAPNCVAQLRGGFSVFLAAVRWMTKNKALTLEQVTPWLFEEVKLLDEKAAQDDTKLTIEQKVARKLEAWSGMQPDHWTPDGASELPDFDGLAARVAVRATEAYANRPRTPDELAARIDRVQWASPERELAQTRNTA